MALCLRTPEFGMKYYKIAIYQPVKKAVMQQEIFNTPFYQHPVDKGYFMDALHGSGYISGLPTRHAHWP